eukprot:SAG25_NODE_2164_length_1883_cov_2.566143_1_plen_163_part_10
MMGLSQVLIAARLDESQVRALSLGFPLSQLLAQGRLRRRQLLRGAPPRSLLLGVGAPPFLLRPAPALRPNLGAPLRLLLQPLQLRLELAALGRPIPRFLPVPGLAGLQPPPLLHPLPARNGCQWRAVGFKTADWTLGNGERLNDPRFSPPLAPQRADLRPEAL